MLHKVGIIFCFKSFLNIELSMDVEQELVAAQIDNESMRASDTETMRSANMTEPVVMIQKSIHTMNIEEMKHAKS